MRKLVISMLICSGLLLAQGPVGRRGGMGPRGMAPQRQAAGQATMGAAALTEYLALTDSQVEQMRTLRKQQSADMKPIVDQMTAKARELNQLMQASSTDAAKVGALMVEMKQLRDKVVAAKAGLRDRIRAVLNADQQAKLKALEEAAKLAPAARQAAMMGLITLPRPAALEEGQLPPAPRLRQRPGFQPRPMMRGRVPGRGPVRF